MAVFGSGRVPHVRQSVHGPKTNFSNAFTLCRDDSCSPPRLRHQALLLRNRTRRSRMILVREGGRSLDMQHGALVVALLL
jgi:hypothetical protein